MGFSSAVLNDVAGNVNTDPMDLEGQMAGGGDLGGFVMAVLQAGGVFDFTIGGQSFSESIANGLVMNEGNGSGGGASDDAGGDKGNGDSQQSDRGNGDSKQNNTQQGYTPAPKNGLPGFPDASDRTFNKQSGRYRWKLPDGSILEWDKQHGEVEKYDKSGKNHEGAYDPNTGERIKDGDAGRSTPKFNTPVTQPYDGPKYFPAYQPGMGNYNRNATNGVIMGGATIIILETIETYWPAVLAL